MITQPIEFLLNPNNCEEIFLPISDLIVKDVKPWYLISNFGSVFSIHSNRLMKPTMSSDGYQVCTLRTNQEKGVTVYIHRIEMMTFKYEPGCEELAIDHIDCNKGNNYIVNLEWVTLAENTRRAALNGLLLTGEDAPWTKVSDEKAHKICELYVIGYGISEIARAVDCGTDSVFRIVHGIGRRDISCVYDIESRYRGILTDEQIHIICKTFSLMKGQKYSHIKLLLSEILGIRINKNVDSIIRCLYRHDIYCFYRISSLYNY